MRAWPGARIMGGSQCLQSNLGNGTNTQVKAYKQFTRMSLAPGALQNSTPVLPLSLPCTLGRFLQSFYISVPWNEVCFIGL